MPVVLAAVWNATERVMLEHIALAFRLSFLIGFERELPEFTQQAIAPCALVGTGAAAVTTVTLGSSPQAIGCGDRGSVSLVRGSCFEATRGMLKMTSAATDLRRYAIGIAGGDRASWLAIGVAVLVLADLELRQIPILKYLGAALRRDDDDLMK